MKKLYTLLLTLVVSSLSFGQTIYSENMGTGTGTLAITATTFQNTSPIAYSGTADTRASLASSGYTGASGERNVFITNTAGKYFQVDNINTSAYLSADIQMSFGYNTTSTSITQLVIEQSTNAGTTWTPITFTPSATGWTLVTVSGGQIPSSTTLSLRFSQPATPSGQFRIDDLKLTNVSSSCTLALGTPVVACSASTLALDSYTVTIPYTGAGNATYTITTAGTVSGDNPTSVAAGNIIVTFTEGSAYTVNITGGTCNLDVNGNSPECKPENTLPYYDGFNYTAGNSLGAEQMWTNVNSGDNITATTGSLSYTGLTPAGNSASFAADGIDCFSPITPTSTGTIYYSFLMNIGSMAGVTDANGGYIAGFGETNTNLGATLWTKRVDDTNFNLGIEVRTANAANTTFDTASYQTGQTYFVVVGYTFNSATTADDVVSLWVNPVVGSPEPTATITDTHAATDLPNASRFFLRQDSSTETPTVQVDELRIGTTWVDVVPATAGLNDNNIDGLTMYPNPLSGNTLYLTSTANDDMSVQIFDLLGKEVVKANVINNTVNVAKLTAGVYVVKITEEGKTATRKLVIK
ncbi:T9SS type A sorting domain-containing protein [Flavobacterium celericrescens]|uniref:T9SS type A sorting domain-containing protein n=1 Tax=Flavobacterium celericrescens TaxID=2709780 RepID=A0ABX0IAJ5_9FLAO|nr:T9SS type A sorting domain-containing protein [Flavobacterium celericrescens]NHM03200.1 T9SS type A sorting domain-containing protein [Flavobacterium celericrescens]